MSQYFYKLLWICFLSNHVCHVDGTDFPCGQTAYDKQSRIHGGEDYDNIFIPWIVSLQGFWYNGISCGGSIIGRKWIVTAAHCVDGYPWWATPGLITGWGYTWNRYLIKDYHKHPSYKQIRSSKGFITSIRDDIALLELKSNIAYGRRIQPICVSRSSVTPGRKCVVSGWGRTDSGTPNNLQRIDVTMGFSTQCNRVSYIENPYDMICLPESPKYACKGDSGGPLTCEEQKGHQFLKGVVSTTANSDCQSDNGDIQFAKVAVYVDWIEKVTGLKLGVVTADGPVVQERMFHRLEEPPERNEPDGQPGSIEPDGQPRSNEHERKPGSNEHEGQPGSNEHEGQPGSNEHEGQPGSNEPDGQLGSIEPDRQPGSNEPDGQLGSNEHEGQPGSNEPDGQPGNNEHEGNPGIIEHEGQQGPKGLALSVHNGLDKPAESPTSSNTASMPMSSSQIFLFVGVPTLTIGLTVLMIVASVLYRKSSHQKADDGVEMMRDHCSDVEPGTE